MMKRLIYTLGALAVLVVSCYYDSEESLYPGENLGSCDTVNVTFSGSIIPLLENNCLSCHGGTVAKDNGGSIVLEDYPKIFEYRNIILSAIKHDGTAQEMPYNTAKLKDCLIQQFDIWVAEGALEN